MVDNKRKEAFSMNLDDNSIKWIEKQIKNGEFDSRSSGVRKCILIAKRVYENGESEEIVKFIIGKK